MKTVLILSLWLFIQPISAQFKELTPTKSPLSNTSDIIAQRAGTQQELLRTGLYFIHTDDTRRQADGVVSVYKNGYSTAVDGNDAMQMANWDEDIAIFRDNVMLSIESRPLIDNADTVPLIIHNMRTMNYEWQFTPSNFNAPGLTAYLQDIYPEFHETPISLSAVTIIPFSITTDPLSKVDKRFTIVYRKTNTLPVQLVDWKAQLQTNGVQLSWQTVAEENMQNYSVERSFNGVDFSRIAAVLPKGGMSNTYSWLDVQPNATVVYYRIAAFSKTGQIQYSAIALVKNNIGKAAVVTYPNPVSGSILSVAISGCVKGNYQFVMYNQLGQIVIQQLVVCDGNAQTLTISVQSLKAGMYEMRLSNNSTLITKKIIKK